MISLKLHSQLTRILSFLVALCGTRGQVTCLHNSIATFEDLVACFDTYTVPDGHYTGDTYNAAQPNPQQLAGWTELVSSLVSVDGNCTSVVVPASLSDIYSVSLFADPTGPEYCVASESTTVDGFYAKGWGLVVVPSTRAAVLRTIHLSAPHPAFDLFTPEQAGALFKSTGAKSLLVAGRSRNAFREPTDCIIPTSNSTVYFKTDPAHDVEQPFFSAAKTMREWQLANGGCPPQSCAFIQMHGKAASTCPTDTMFLSTGLGMSYSTRIFTPHSPMNLGNSTTSVAWYRDSVDRPIKRLKKELMSAFPMWNISLPSDSSCSLTATENVFGRLINGIAEVGVCALGSNARLATGQFIHIEQAAISRQPEAYASWTTAILAAFASSSVSTYINSLR
ncbi:hypothetical protein C8J57DRAFT_491371 [Mycena rebaudengoi]|nr:hypothetical protein C8J57DRAFT_491371 [Mycena rebaudengoi]